MRVWGGCKRRKGYKRRKTGKRRKNNALQILIPVGAVVLITALLII